MFTKAEAILSLNPESQFAISNDELIWHSSDIKKPSDSEINAEINRLQAEYEANQYQRDRLQEYPSIQELIVALYDEEDKASIIERRNAVKAKYPKPE